MSALLLLFGVIIVCVVFIFSFGVVVGMIYEGALRPRRRGAVEVAVRRLLDADAALVRTRPREAEILEYAEARARVVRMVKWQSPSAPVRAVVRQAAPAATELAS
jgi:hypothetical protein